MPTLTSPSLISRPFRSMRDLWLMAALFVAVKATPGGVDKQTSIGFALFACLLAAVWALGRFDSVRRFFDTLLGVSQPDDTQGDDAGSEIGPRIFSVISERTERDSSKWSWIPWMMVGAALVSGALAFLEWRQPYYFVQDDNLSQFFPVVLHGCRSLLHDGIFPTWNPHQFLGSPTTSLGTYALTYPFTYLSYAIADGVVGNEYATLDVFCILHLLAGYFAAFWACRVIGIRSSLSATTAICFAISGFFWSPAGRGFI